MRRMLEPFIFALVLVLVLVLSSPAIPASAAEWEPNSVADALLGVQFPPDDLSWQSAMMEDTADAYDGAVRQVQVYTFQSLTVFSVYPTEAGAADRIIGDICLPIDQSDIDIFSGDDFTGRLVAQEADRILGIDICVIDTGTGAGASGRIDNIVVTGISTYSASDTPAGAAMVAAIKGLALVSALLPDS
ncbi:MAG: hypothetical protein ACKOWF_11475 [Chloroflexota bacterium]